MNSGRKSSLVVRLFYEKHSNCDCDLLQEHKKKMKCLVFAAFVFTLIFSVSAQGCDPNAVQTCALDFANMVSILMQ